MTSPTALHRFWKKYSFYIQNIMVILSSAATLVAAVLFESLSSVWNDSDMLIIWISPALIIAISSGSMLVHYLGSVTSVQSQNDMMIT